MSSASPEHETVQRLFFALWPDEAVRDRLWWLSRRTVHGKGRAVAREKLHMTLAFLGSVSRDTRTCMEEVAAGVRAGAFRLEVDQVGYWSRSRIMWAGAVTPPPLAALVTDLNARLAADCGYQPDRRPFRAHITLARKVRAVRPIVAVEAIAWPVTCFSLVESLSEPGGARYEVLASWPLTETPVL